MNTERKPYCVNQIMKGEIIFERGSEAAYVGLVLKAYRQRVLIWSLDPDISWD